ncbi:hypothetical protein [Spongiivirga citrea]|uniref:Uncharacterized protein n=1 Tax=Spongiivirga citrea TaxID=1481457 RepID=A0A6M0CFH0_9FLAO|nr:hypothetical protein [Spongiivirga citrea]NER16541.1 hypothetical protein [Spongiivirga citrea]
MSCKQFSGIFLNIACRRQAEKKCSKCEKDTCLVHTHTLNSKTLCEDCYWEQYLYDEQNKPTPVDYYDDDGTVFTSSSSYDSRTSDSDVDSFEDGFSGGEFGGGGASGDWSEEDINSFDQTDMNDTSLGTNEGSFFYS